MHATPSLVTFFCAAVACAQSAPPPIPVELRARALDFYYDKFQALKAIAKITSSGTSTAATDLVSLAGNSSQARLASAVFTASDFNVIVSALKTQNNTKIVSNPTIVTLNNTEAFINIGQEFPIPNYTYNAANQMITAGAATLTYNNNGNLISGLSGATWMWDRANRAILANGSIHKYDGLGIRTDRLQNPRSCSSFPAQRHEPRWRLRGLPQTRRSAR
ncbi:MAG: hypothetical protein HC794_09210 [Nitrospiraceae bacterium]|nr:hypothetical protein [Nitrospiraceae bacterium]